MSKKITKAKIKQATGKFVSTRTNAITSEALNTALNHNLRLGKRGNEKVKYPKRMNLAMDYKNKNLKGFKKDSKLGINQKQQVKKTIDFHREQHKMVWNANHKASNNWKSRKKSFAESVVWFGGKDEGEELQSDSLMARLIDEHGMEQALRLMMPMAQEHFENMAEEHGLELLGPLVAHLDEEGQPHFHQLHTNYLAKGDGSSPNFRQNKNKAGAKLQDSIYESFKALGFERGISHDERKEVGQTVKHEPSWKYIKGKTEEAEATKTLEKAKEATEYSIKAQTRIKESADAEAGFIGSMMKAGLQKTVKEQQETIEAQAAVKKADDATIASKDATIAKRDEKITEHEEGTADLLIKQKQALIDLRDKGNLVILEAQNGTNKAEYMKGMREGIKATKEELVEPLKKEKNTLTKERDKWMTIAKKVMAWIPGFRHDKMIADDITKQAKKQYPEDQLFQNIPVALRPEANDIDDQLEKAKELGYEPPKPTILK